MRSNKKELYSPIPDVHRFMDIEINKSNEKELFNHIARARNNVLGSSQIEPQIFDNVRNIVMESWVRSKNKGINPNRSIIKFVENDRLNQLLQQNQCLLNAAKPFVDQLELLLNDPSHMIGLYDANGTILYLRGDKNTLSLAEKYQIVPGAVFSEDTVGTCANGLCSILKKPVQISGPEHYSDYLLNSNCSSAPIFTKDGDLAGVLSIESILTPKQHPHTLGLVTSMSKIIQSELSMIQKNKDLVFIESALRLTLDKSDYAYLVINEKGNFVLSNAETYTLLGITENELRGKHYTDFFSNQPAIARALSEGCSANNVEAVAKSHRGSKACFYNVDPMIDDRNQKINGAVITFSQKRKSYNLPKMYTHSSDHITFSKIIGKSEGIRKAIDYAQNVSKLPVNVLLTGESGTGKELFAQSIHEESQVEGPFIAVNCAALPRTLIESELFGYEGGSFTGADRNGRPGKIEQANGGTLFLDEIGDMPLDLQPVLLRVLQDKKVTRIGSSRSTPVEFRLVAATNKNLIEMIKEKQFREDLYFRLAVFKIAIPPLRERDDDTVLLANYFLDELSGKMNKTLPKLSSEARKTIINYSWPGNIRQLENAMVHALCVCSGAEIEKEHLPDEMFHYHTYNADNRILTISEMEKMAIIKAMQQTKNNTLTASELLGIGRTTLYKKLKEYSISCT